MNRTVTLKDVYKGYTLDLDKAVPPNETISRFKEKLKAIDLDILENTVRIDNGRLDIPVYISICGKDAEKTVGKKRQMGKGGTPNQAEASAIMELVERFSLFSFSRNSNNFVIEEYMNIKDRALPFKNIAESVHDNSQDLESAREIFSSLQLKWVRGYNLTKDEEVLIPFDWFLTISEFNGSAAGNCIEEAILQGICEVVERHASSVISRNKLEVPHIDLTSVTDPLALELIHKYNRVGIKLYASDFTLDTGIPTVAVLAYDPSTFPKKSEIIWTAGTTTAPQKALIRALTEAAQLAGDFNTGSSYEPSGLPKFKNLAEADFVIHPRQKVPFSSMPDLSDDNMRLEIKNCVAALSKRGMETLVVDVTHPELKIPAVYNIVPGAHFRERAAGTSVGMFSAKLIAENSGPERAIDQLLKMDELLPGKYYTKFYLGLSHISANQPSKALEYFEKSLDLEPEKQDIPTIYSYMGICLKELENYEKAIKILEKAEEYDNERTDIYNLMGFCYFKLKEHENAIKCFKKVLHLNPASAIDYANIASNYRDMGDRKKAIRYYQLALELDPTIEFAIENLQNLKRMIKK
jgi:ribosomal protein S12 methylthiotransferase accessory factor